jgi:hypothetical protein
MYTELRTKGKRLLSKLLPDSTKLRYLSYLPKLESFRKTHSEKHPIFTDRFTMYQYINDAFLKNRPIMYCEFGVYKGATIEKWANLNSDKDSLFYGFDTFTGLPETWVVFTESIEKNTFDVGGNIPKIDDDRISFIKGLFQETLPEFLENYNNNHQLVIHNDSDLYSSTLYVLTLAHKIIVPGTIIIFDEFSSILNEFRALEDYTSSYLRDYEVIAATVSSTGYYSQVAIKMV